MPRLPEFHRQLDPRDPLVIAGQEFTPQVREIYDHFAEIGFKVIDPNIEVDYRHGEPIIHGKDYPRFLGRGCVSAVFEIDSGVVAKLPVYINPPTNTSRVKIVRESVAALREGQGTPALEQAIGCIDNSRYCAMLCETAPGPSLSKTPPETVAATTDEQLEAVVRACGVMQDRKLRTDTANSDNWRYDPGRRCIYFRNTCW
jgi:hypothetical protein